MIMNTHVNVNRYTISDLNSEVYLINIETNNGNVVHKIVRL